MPSLSGTTDAEKVHGCNGLLLASHVDHPFDRGWISFSDAGDLMVASRLSLELLHAWGITAGRNVGHFSEDQGKFLDYHRTRVFCS
jgi:putative restriction endonuclease